MSERQRERERERETEAETETKTGAYAQRPNVFKIKHGQLMFFFSRAFYLSYISKETGTVPSTPVLSITMALGYNKA